MDVKALFTRRATGAVAPSEDPVQAARTRARRRLIGAAVLLVVGVVAFPLLFETRPRPLPMNTPIVAAGGEVAASPAPGASAAVASGQVAPPLADAASAPVRAAASAPNVSELPVPAETPAPAEARAPELPASRPAGAPGGAPAGVPPVVAATASAASAAASAPRPGRYVVQVGAFADAAAAREVRLKVEKLGLKTYTQVVEVEGGRRTRVRVGPFASREEAQQTLARIQRGNLPGVVLAL